MFIQGSTRSKSTLREWRRTFTTHMPHRHPTLFKMRIWKQVDKVKRKLYDTGTN